MAIKHRLSKETLLEMRRKGHAYRHEVVAVVDEILERREFWDKNEIDYDGLVIRVPATQLNDRVYPWASSSINGMRVNTPYVFNIAGYWPSFIGYKYEPEK